MTRLQESNAANGRKSPKESLLDAAEALFAESGFAGVSLRKLTGMAGTNLASVNYHFGSKERLFSEVVNRRLHPINAKRVEALEAILARVGNGSLRLEDLLDAFARPFFESSRDPEHGPGLRRLVVRLFMEADSVVVPLFEKELLPVAQQFAIAIARARPGLSRKQILFGQLFFAGAMINALASRKRFESLQAFVGGPVDDEELLEALVRHGAAGFDALAGWTDATAAANTPQP